MLRLTIPRPAIALAATCAVLGASAWAIDTGAAITAEHAASEAIRAAEPAGAQSVTPRVSFAAPSFLLSARKGKLAHIEVRLIDVPTETFGPITVTTSGHQITGSSADIRAGHLDGLDAHDVTRSASLDAAAVGKILDMDDIDISNPDDVSPSAAARAHVRLSGTPAGCSSPATIIADLRVTAQTIHITPTTVETHPTCSAFNGNDDTAVKEKFTWSAPGSTLPIVGNIVSFLVRGGSLFLESQNPHPTHLNPQLFTVE
ncbi:LmeA family phospholipid-binding protein [Corynebacterium aquilae]|uniref:LmeA family phospholipid-binding protein n=1 Tax=Corynebacterium aquilae TaxID=203263 RepID=UPI000951BD9E|nr:DUF2993 domain-containing protein [Corynebacterium aquilae]